MQRRITNLHRNSGAMNPIIEYIKDLESLVDEDQRGYYEQMLWDAKEVKCVSVRDVFSGRDIKYIKSFVKPKECFKNAVILASVFHERCEYVEGYGCAFFPVEHAFNKIDGKYIDITWELALNEDVTDWQYISLIEADIRDVMKDIAKHGNCAGDYYRHKFFKI